MILTNEAILEVQRLYAEKDFRGRRLWSHARIAKTLGVSEGTIFRVLNGLGAYMGEETHQERVVRPEITADEAQASLDRLLGLTGLGAAVPAAGVKKEE